jgi:hypothetical protein
VGRPIGESGTGETLRDLPRISEAVRQVLRTGDAVASEAHAPGSRGAGPRVWLMSWYPVRDADGRVCGMSAAAVDTTEQFRARRRLDILNEAGAH